MHGYPVLVRVIGPPDLVGEIEQPERDKAVELACSLALHKDRPMPGEELRAALWPGELGEPGVTAKSLRNTAAILRRAMGPDHFPEARRGSGYQLGPRVGCDWTVFCELEAAASGEDEKECLRQALSLVRGAPFQGVKPRTYTWAWTEHWASTIEAGIRSAAYRFCELVLAEGDHESAVRAALQALAVDPYDRTLWEWYLRAAARSSRRRLEQAWKEAQSALLDDALDFMELMTQLRSETR
jgi:DNA-binding SARP family transcriptional activator